MARLPDKEALGAPVFGRRPAATLSGGEAVGKGIAAVGDALAKIGEQQNREEDSLDLIKANAVHRSALYDIDRSFDNDPNYDTYEPRFQEQADAATQEAASNIRNPALRQKWELITQPHNAAALNGVMKRGNALRQQQQVADLQDSLNEHLKTFADPSGTEEQRTQAKTDMNTALDLAQHVGIVNPLRALKLRQQYSAQADEAAIRTRIARGDDIEDILHDLQGGHAAPPVDTQESPETRAQPFSGQVQAPSANDTARAAISTQLETGAADPLKGVANISRDSGGTKSYGNFGLNSGGSAQKFVGEYGEALGLQGEPGTAQFDKSWKQVAAADPEGLHQAELDWYSKTITDGLPQRLIDAGVPETVANDQRVQAYFADRSIQQGPGSIDESVKHRQRIQAAADDAGDDPVAFLENMTEADRAAYRQDFPTAIKSGVYPVEGHDNRLNGRLEMALGIGNENPQGPQAAAVRGPYPDLNPHQRNTLINIVKVANRELSHQDIRDGVAEILNTGEAPLDARGRTALDRARLSMTQNEFTKAQFQWQAAQETYKAVLPLPNMTEADAQAHIDGLRPNHKLDVEHYAMADKVEKAAEKAWEKVRDLRAKDPATAVETTLEVQQARQAMTVAGNRATQTQRNEIVIEARKAAQARLGIPPWQQRIITEAEAGDLLQLPHHPESVDEVDKALDDATQRAKDAYGKYAPDALDSAISLWLKGKENKDEARLRTDALRAQMNPPPKPPEKGWFDWLRGGSPPSQPGANNAAPAAKTPASAANAAPVPTQDQVNWATADPENRQAVFDEKFGPGSYAKAVAARGSNQ